MLWTFLEDERQGKDVERLRAQVVLRPLQVGDVAIVDFAVTRLDTGELISGSERRGMQLDTGLGDRAIGLNGAPSINPECREARSKSGLEQLQFHAS